MILSDRLQRVALARILSDLIEADFIIEASEIESLEVIQKRFCITKEMFIEAKGRDFSWAVRMLSQLDWNAKKEVKDTLCSLALSDGTCVPREALQIMAVVYALDGKGEAFSIPSCSDRVDSMKVIYVENEEGTETSAYIADNYRAVCNEFQLAGFDFVYIPKIAEDYRQMDVSYLGKVIAYMVPMVTVNQAQAIQNDLCSMTTSRFCHEILYGKMGLKVLGTKPALLFKTGESYVVASDSSDNGERSARSNYLKVDLEENVLRQVKSLTDDYRRMVSCKTVVEIHPQDGKFIYRGFHKSLFDLVAFCHDRSPYRLVINLESRKEETLVFRPENENGEDVIPRLTPLAQSLYLLMVFQTLSGNGLDWRENINKDDRENILRKYNTLYVAIGNREKTMDYKDRTLVSRIRRELGGLQSSITNIDLFIPELRTDREGSFYIVPVSQKNIFVVENGKEQPLERSSFWASWQH